MVYSADLKSLEVCLIFHELVVALWRVTIEGMFHETQACPWKDSEDQMALLLSC
jgi:hypothetical protein